jgi:hypothetical protein
VRVQAFADPEAAVADVKGEGRIKATGRVYRQEYVVFLRASAGKIAFLREYFDPTRAAKAMGAAFLDVADEPPTGSDQPVNQGSSEPKPDQHDDGRGDLVPRLAFHAACSLAALR